MKIFRFLLLLLILLCLQSCTFAQVIPNDKNKVISGVVVKNQIGNEQEEDQTALPANSGKREFRLPNIRFLKKNPLTKDRALLNMGICVWNSAKIVTDLVRIIHLFDYLRAAIIFRRVWVIFHKCRSFAYLDLNAECREAAKKGIEDFNKEKRIFEALKEFKENKNFKEAINILLTDFRNIASKCVDLQKQVGNKSLDIKDEDVEKEYNKGLEQEAED